MLFVAAGVGYAIGMIALLAAFPIPEWNGIQDTVAGFSTAYVNFYSLCQVMAFLSAPIYVVMLCCIHEITPVHKKILTRLAICFGIIFAALSSINYFVQFTSVRINVLQGRLEGLEPFVQWNPTSALYFVNLLGWTLFLGLSTLFVAQAFARDRQGNTIRWLFMLNGIVCILGAIAAVFEVLLYLAVFPLLMTVFISLASYKAGILFKRGHR